MNSEPNVDRMLRRIERLKIPKEARIVAVGSDGPGLVQRLRTDSWSNAVSLDASEALDPAPADYAAHGAPDLIVASGFLEHLRWDRWELQRMHAALRPDGLLLLAVPNLFSARSLVSPVYLAARVHKLLARWGLATGVDRAAGSPGRPQRAYERKRLRLMLVTLGFELLFDADAAGGLASHAVLIARRKPSLFGVAGGRAFPGAWEHRRTYEASVAGHIRARAGWSARHPDGSGPASALDPAAYAGRTVLVLSPHPDDELIGCGGTLLAFVRAGARVVILQATDGAASASLEGAPEPVRRSVRLDEATRVAAAAGFATTEFWREDNRSFAYRDELVERMRALFRTHAPAVVFTPFVTDVHADHLTLNRLFAEALNGVAPGAIEVLAYEVWGLVPANRYCDVAGYMPELERLLHLYPTAMKVDDFVHMCADRDYTHALEFTGRPGFAEAFLSTDARAFRDIVTEEVARREPGRAR